MTLKVGIAGFGAIGKTVANALNAGKIDGLSFHAMAEINPPADYSGLILDFKNLTRQCDLIIEALPPESVPALTQAVFAENKDLVLISSAALILYPDILEQHKRSKSRIIVPSGALLGLDGVKALKEIGIIETQIQSIKPPKGFHGAPHIIKEAIDLNTLNKKTMLFQGNAIEAAAAFPANLNVAATLALAGPGPEHVQVEIWADPQATTNTHAIKVKTELNMLEARISNAPAPQNPKTSVLAAQSIIATLRDMNSALVVL